MSTARDHDPGRGDRARSPLTTAVLQMQGLHWASEKAIVEATLGRLEGVRTVEANPVGQTATVSYDPTLTNIAELRRWVEECGYHCAGQSVPDQLVDPLRQCQVLQPPLPEVPQLEALWQRRNEAARRV